MKAFCKGAEQFALLDQAWSKLTPTSVHDYALGPLRFRLVFANEILKSKIVTAFAHLAVPPVIEPDLIIHLWDTHHNQTPLPALDFKMIYSNGYQGYSENKIYFQYFEAVTALSAFNSHQKKAYYVVKNSDTLPWWVSGSPLQVILSAWLSENQLQLTHTASVGSATEAILLMGKGGSGKSTTVLSCLDAGLNYLGEDYCVLSTDLPGPTAYSVYQSAKLEAHTRRLFPRYEMFIKNPLEAKTEKALVFYQDLFPNQIKTGLPIKAALSLRVGNDQKPLLQAQSQQEALKNLGLSTIGQLPFSGPRSMEVLKNVLSPIDCYQLILGRDVRANVAVLKDILASEKI